VIVLRSRGDVIDAPFGVGGGAPKVGEVEPAAGLKHQVIGHIAGLRRDDLLNPRPVRLNRDDGTDTSGDVHGRDEDPPVLVDRDAAGAELVQADEGGEALVLGQTEHAAP
jgi:hypothetical protein